MRDARFAANPPREGDETYAPRADAPITASIVNTGDATERLLDVTSPVAGGSVVAGDRQIPGGVTLVSGNPDPTCERAPCSPRSGSPAWASRSARA